MPKYAQDLTDYLANIGDQEPTEALGDIDLLSRSLSMVSPLALVGKVAEALEDVDNHPAVITLSLYEKGRVMSALDRRKESVVFYREALEICKDPDLRGFILINLAVDVPDRKEAENILRQAIEEGHNEALVHLGNLLYRRGETEEAIELLLQSICNGVSLGLPILGEIYALTKEGDDLEDALWDMITLAKAAGIEDPVHKPFEQLDAQTFGRAKDGSVINLISKSQPIRDIIAAIFGRGKTH